ncbi:MAG: hypothetical protein ACD_43C00087G0003, partial [uncultured bacterium]
PQPSSQAPVPTANAAAIPTTPTNPELSSGATAAIGAGIGIGNICCSPFCYGCPTLLSSMVGLILYFSWKQDKPKTAHNILLVTLITGGIGLAVFGVIFLLGLSSAIIDELNY